MTAPDDAPPTLPGSDVPQPPRRRGRPRGSTDKAPRVPGGKKTAERAARAAAEPAHVHIAEVVADAKAEKRGRTRSFLRSPHGAAKERGLPGPRVELPPADELGALPAALPVQEVARTNSGRFKKGNPLAAVGGYARGKQVAYATRIGLRAEFVEAAPEDFKAHMRHAASYRQARIGELALTVGQSGIGPGVKVRVGQAALEIGASKYLFEQGVKMMASDPAMALKFMGEARKMDDSSRQNELCAHELAVREAKARGADRGPLDPFAGQRAALPNYAGSVDVDNTNAKIRPDPSTLTTPVEVPSRTRTGDIDQPTSTVMFDASPPSAQLDPGGER